MDKTEFLSCSYVYKLRNGTHAYLLLRVLQNKTATLGVEFNNFNDDLTYSGGYSEASTSGFDILEIREVDPNYCRRVAYRGDQRQAFEKSAKIIWKREEN